MSTLFGAATWKKLSDNPLPTIGQLVNGIERASYHPASRTLQIFSLAARVASGPESNSGFHNTAAISFDGGSSWTFTYRGDEVVSNAQREWVINGWSTQTPGGLYHFQVRVNAKGHFFDADGTLYAGGMALYAAGPGQSAFTFAQQLYTWPHIIADPVDTGGNNIWSVLPSLSQPLHISGSGPDGEDAWWMAVGGKLDVGGTNNRATILMQDLWRSLDGLVWEKVVDLSATGAATATRFSQIVQSTTGRILLVGGDNPGIFHTDDGPDLIGAVWTGATGSVDFIGSSVIGMHGGTLVTTRNGTSISAGFVRLSCDDGATIFSSPTSPAIPVDSVGFVMKLGPAEVLLITNGFNDPDTETVAWYSADGGETFAGGEVWLSTTIGERSVAAFVRTDGRPLVVTRNRVFFSSDKALGVAGTRTQCPLANAGLAPARPLVLCGHPLTNLCENH